MNDNFLEKALEMFQQLERRKQIYRAEYYKAYPYQLKFHHAEGYQTPGKLAIFRALCAANGVGKCVTYQTLIEHPDGSSTPAGELYARGTPFSVSAWDGSRVVEATAVTPIKKPAEECFRAYLRNGKWFECAGNHRILTKSGWKFFSDVRPYVRNLPASSLELFLLIRASDVRHLFGKLLNCLGRCSGYFHLDDAQLRNGSNTVQVSPPLQVDAQILGSSSSYEGDLANRYTNNRQLENVRPSNFLHAVRRILGRCVLSLVRVAHIACQPLTVNIRELPLLVRVAYPQSGVSLEGRYLRTCSVSSCESEFGGHNRNGESNASFFQVSTRSRNEKLLPRQANESDLSLISPFCDDNQIIAYHSVGVQDVYDFTVPEYENYITAGVVHHNTLCGCMENSYHLTGQYPEWWKGHRFNMHTNLLCAGLTNESVRDIIQREMFGDPNDPKALGTGTVPINCIGKINRKSGITNAFDNVKVRHKCGLWSTVYFRAYEQGWKKFMGTRYEIFHADEEPPEEIWDQLIRALMSKKKGIGYLTFTPEEGVTKVVNAFMNNPGEGQAFINAEWKDASHMMTNDGKFTEQARILAANIPKHQLEMRTKGIPLSGEGMVFNVADDVIKVKPFPIPSHWPQLVAIDFGWDHPFAAARLAWDRDNDCIYLINEYRESKALPAVHAQAIQAWGGWQPVAWPHDGLNTEKGTGDELIKQYRDLKLNCLPEKVTNPPEPGKPEGSGGNSVEASVLDMLVRMETGRFKVFETCQLFFEEKRMYHRKDGKIVKLADDLLSAVRYGVMGIRFAKTNVSRPVGNMDTTRNGAQYLSARPKRRT